MTTPNAVTREDIMKLASEYASSIMRCLNRIPKPDPRDIALKALEAAITQLCNERDEAVERARISDGTTKTVVAGAQDLSDEIKKLIAERDEWKRKAEEALEVLNEYPRDVI